MVMLHKSERLGVKQPVIARKIFCPCCAAEFRAVSPTLSLNTVSKRLHHLSHRNTLIETFKIAVVLYRSIKYALSYRKQRDLRALALESTMSGQIPATIGNTAVNLLVHSQHST